MKRISILAMLMLLLLPIGFAGCSSSDEEDYAMMPTGLSSIKVPVEIVATTNFPDWLSNQINGYHGSVWVFKGTWEGETVYYLYSYLMSSYLYEVYNAEGNRMDIADKEAFINKSKSWKCIYLPKQPAT